jgi:hypothetical protein
MLKFIYARELNCSYESKCVNEQWCHYRSCQVTSYDFLQKDKLERHSFSGSVEKKLQTNTLNIDNSPSIVEFIPTDMFSEFPNLNGLDIGNSYLPVIKADLFPKTCQRLEYLFLGRLNISSIEPNAFNFLINLKWLRLVANNIKSLPYEYFRNNLNLIYVDLDKNRIENVNVNLFKNLKKLQVLDLKANKCVAKVIGCETCLVSQAELDKELSECHSSCLEDAICLTNSVKALHTASDAFEAELKSLTSTLRKEIYESAKRTLFQVNVSYVKKSDLQQFYFSLIEKINGKPDDLLLSDQPVNHNCFCDRLEKSIEQKLKGNLYVFFFK